MSPELGCPRSGHYVFNKLDYGLSSMILMVINNDTHDLKVHFDLKKSRIRQKRPIIRQNMKF